ncbi:hypothetical protein [Pseudarthrobacter enclensis]|uniref:Uncharacterized protein n=1 Tax=Pseudarthrobacter enclensis TaxID=993070 RepID=A0ABT9RW85_9MICC|nr:hypothetical protein [Pseudarthrobacter enclensis]MDP9889502.1 hypothetical protein [Pseudarthrobacter enclensis]
MPNDLTFLALCLGGSGFEPIEEGQATIYIPPTVRTTPTAADKAAPAQSSLAWSCRAGSLRLAASANLNPDRRFPSMFGQVHGSAPGNARQGISNPIVASPVRP